MDGAAQWATVCGVTKVRYYLASKQKLTYFISWSEFLAFIDFLLCDGLYLWKEML